MNVQFDRDGLDYLAVLNAKVFILYIEESAAAFLDILHKIGRSSCNYSLQRMQINQMSILLAT